MVNEQASLESSMALFQIISGLEMRRVGLPTPSSSRRRGPFQTLLLAAWPAMLTSPLLTASISTLDRSSPATPWSTLSDCSLTLFHHDFTMCMPSFTSQLLVDVVIVVSLPTCLRRELLQLKSLLLSILRLPIQQPRE